MTFTLPMNPLLELLEDANRTGLELRLHPSRYPIVGDTISAAGGEWRLELRISSVFDPGSLGLYERGALLPVRSISFGRPE